MSGVRGVPGKAALIGLLLVVAVGLLSGCAILVDEKFARVCRSVVPALHPEGTDFRFGRVRALGDGRSAVRVDYQVGTAGAARGPQIKDHWIACRFSLAAFHADGMPQITGVVTDRLVLGEVRLALLLRHWLPGATDPSPQYHVDDVPDVSRSIAVLLQQALASLPMIALLGFISAAYALIYSLIGRLTLGFGEMAALASYASLLAVAVMSAKPLAAVSLALASLIAVMTGLAHGKAFGRFVLAPLGDRRPEGLLIASVGLSIALQEYLRLLQGPAHVWAPSMLNAPLAVARSGEFVVTVTAIGLLVASLSLIMGAVLLLLMRHSRFGRLWRAASDDPLAYALMGLDPRAMLVEAAMLACVTAAFAGFLMTLFYGGVGYAGGHLLGLKALCGAVIGGLGSVPGALAGGLLIGLFEAIWSAYFPIEQRDLALLLVLAAFLVLRPEGLAGKSVPQFRRDD